MSAQDKFEELAEEVSSKAAKVSCSKEDYIGGLQHIMQTLQTDIQTAEEV